MTTNLPSSEQPDVFSIDLLQSHFGAPLSAAHQGAMPPLSWEALVTDSRAVSGSLAPRVLFAAISGETHDGHQYIDGLCQLGLGAVLGSDEAKMKSAALRYPKTTFFLVPNVTAALRSLARSWRRRFPIPVVAVAGSVGKTSTKEMLATLLEQHFPGHLLKTQASQNGFLGIPLTLLQLRSHHRAAVIEVGIDEPDAMIQHLEIVDPTHSLVTAIGPEHMEKLKDLETVFREESLALTWPVSRGAFVYLNEEDPYLSRLSSELPKTEKVYRVSLRSFQARTTSSGLFQFLFQPDSADHASTPIWVTLPLAGEHQAKNAALAFSVALHGFKIPAHELAKSVELLRPSAGRGQLKQRNAPCGVCSVYEDYYNANPSSMEAAFRTVSELAAGLPRQRWVACLGDMRELGPGSNDYHRDLAAPLLAAKPHGIFLWGPEMKALAHALSRTDAPSSPLGAAPTVYWSEDMEDLKTNLESFLKPHDLLLVKGSRGSRMERILDGWSEVSPSSN